MDFEQGHVSHTVPGFIITLGQAPRLTTLLCHVNEPHARHTPSFAWLPWLKKLLCVYSQSHAYHLPANFFQLVCSRGKEFGEPHAKLAELRSKRYGWQGGVIWEQDGKTIELVANNSEGELWSSLFYLSFCSWKKKEFLFRAYFSIWCETDSGKLSTLSILKRCTEKNWDRW